MTAPVDTVRKQIIVAMRDAYRAVAAAAPTGDPFGIEFSICEIGPLLDNANRKRAAVGIVAGKERKEFLYPYIQCWLMVHIEFRYTVNQPDPSSTGEMAEDALGVVQRVFLQDRTWGGLALDTKEKGNELDLSSYMDRTIQGVLHLEVQYRTSHKDTRDPGPDI